MNLHLWHDNALNDIENKLTDILEQNVASATLLDAIKYSTLGGGKRIRPLFTLASGSLSNADYDNLLQIGCALEMIHCFSLIHDDLPIMDNDDLRRGKPTNHVVYGDAVALLAGDALHAWCFEILSSDKLRVSDAKKIRIMHTIAQAIGINGMVAGQAIDWLSTGKELNLANLQLMHQLKTGALLKASIISGYLAGNETTVVKFDIIMGIAEKIGLLFQIVDDIIDATQDTATLGKTANKDAAQNKATYVSVLGLNQAQIMADQLYNEIIKLINTTQINSEKLTYLTSLVYSRNN